MTVDVYSLTGTKVKTLELSESVFGHAVKPELLAQAIRVYLSNQRQGTKHAKTRAEVSYSTHKIWRQKGTGRARHGSRRAPIFVGGGVAHGPTGNENYTLKLTRKMRTAALKGALTLKAQDKAIRVIDGLDKATGKTKDWAALLTKMQVNPQHRTLVILDQPLPAAVKALNNLQSVTATQVKRLNTFEVINHDAVIFTTAALNHLQPASTAKSSAAGGPAPKKSTAKKPATRKPASTAARSKAGGPKTEK